MLAAGAAAFTDDGDGIADADLMRKVLQSLRLAGHGLHAALPGADAHPRRPDARGRGERQARPGGLASSRRGADARARSPSGSFDRRAATTPSTSPAAVRWRSSEAARDAGVPATGEVSPHHLLLTDAACEGLRHEREDEPPAPRGIRSTGAACRASPTAIITVLATDHAPHTTAEKSRPFEVAPLGVIGVETALAALCGGAGRTPAPSTGPASSR